MLFLIPVVYGIECQRLMNPVEANNCTLTSTWKPSAGCAVEIRIHNSVGSLVQTQNWTEQEPYCVSDWNITSEGVWQYNSTIEDGTISIEKEDNMTSLGIFIFLILLNITLFLLPSFVQFTQGKATNNIVKHIVYLTGLTVLAFNTTIFATLADNAGLGITKELFVFQNFFLIGISAGMILLFFSIIVSTPKIWKEERDKKRMGDND